MVAKHFADPPRARGGDMWWWMTVAWAGQGDPVDGQPSWEERSYHLWSNAVRGRPDAFLKDYQEGGCEFSTFTVQEQAGVGRMGLSVPLSRVALAHSEDLDATGTWSHESSDGTSMVARIQAAYGEGKPFAENLARGFDSARAAVAQGWMCSPGHRKNLMDPRWDEVGHGVVGRLATQDLGRGSVAVPRVPVAVHEPQQPDGSVAIWVDVAGDLPLSVSVVIDGVALPAREVWRGTTGQTWVVETQGDGRCTPWFVEVLSVNGRARWPETGSYGWGRCTWDDARAQWLAFQVEIGEGPTDTGEGLGDDVADTDADSDVDPEQGVDLAPWSNLCSTIGGGAVVGPLWVLVAGVVRRRRANNLSSP
jgi:hypothetical protein